MKSWLRANAVFCAISQAENTPICERYQLHDVPTGSVSEIVITDTGWHLVSKGLAPAAEK